MTIFTDERGRAHTVEVLQKNASFAYIQFANGRCEAVRVAMLSEPEEPPPPQTAIPKPKKAKL